MELFVLQTAESTDWPEAMIAVAGIVFIMVVAAVLIWQLGSSYRARMSLAREAAYQKLAEEAVEAERRAAESLERTAASLSEIERRTSEMERMLKEVG